MQNLSPPSRAQVYNVPLSCTPCTVVALEHPSRGSDESTLKAPLSYRKAPLWHMANFTTFGEGVVVGGI